MRLALTAIASALIVGTASAAPPPGDFHLFDPLSPRYHVTLELGDFEDGGCPNLYWPLRLVDQTGKVSQAPFQVPKQSHFVLTDVAWSAGAGLLNGMAPHNRLVIRAHSGDPLSLTEPRVVSYADGSSDARTFGDGSLASGAVFSEQEVLCIRIDNEVSPEWNFPTQPAITSAVAHGFIYSGE